MIRWKTTLVLLAATVGIGAYISLYEIRQPLPEEREQAAQRILDIPADPVTAISLEVPNGKISMGRDGSAGWHLEPDGHRADGSRITQLLSHLSPLQARRILRAQDGGSLDPAAYGLDPPVGQLRIRSAEAAWGLRFGESTPVGNSRYLMLEGRPEIFVIPEGLFEDSNHPPETFRDALLVRFNTWMADEVSLASPPVSWTLTRTERDWQLAEPVTDQANRTEVTALMDRLGQLSIARFLERAEDLSVETGLAQPHTRLTLTLHESPEPLTLRFGAAFSDDDSLMYAARSDETWVYAVAAEDVKALVRQPHELRARTCLEFFLSAATRLGMTHTDQTWAIERRDTAWYPEGSDERLDPRAVDELLNALADLRVQAFLDEPQEPGAYGLEAPAGTIALWTGDQDPPQRILVGGATAEGSGNRYARLEPRNVVVELPEEITTLLETTLDSLRPGPGAQEPVTDEPT